jgi:hypothetical protein
MKIPQITKLNIPQIVAIASRFSHNGKLAISQNNLSYLNIDDHYINQLLPLLNDQNIKMPNYFGKGGVGAHITIMYPEEGKVIAKNDLDQEHRFSIKDLVTAKIGEKFYYVLLVESPSLVNVRRKYGLPDLLCFKGYAIGFHITIGVK